MNYRIIKEVAKNMGITDKMLVYYCSNEQIKKAKKFADACLISVNGKKHIELPYKNNKVTSGENK